MVGWHHWLNRHEFEKAPGADDGQGSLAFCSSWVTKSWTRLSDWTELIIFYVEFPGGSINKEFACNAGNPSSILCLGKSPRGGNGNPLQYSCLGNPMDRFYNSISYNILLYNIKHLAQCLAHLWHQINTYWMNVLINKREITERGIDRHQIYVFFICFILSFPLQVNPLLTTHAKKKKKIRKIHTPMKNAAISPLFTLRNFV